jgi:hypothetical protein
MRDRTTLIPPLTRVERRKVVMTNVPENADEPEVASESAAEEIDLADGDLEGVSGGTIYTAAAGMCP